MPYNKVNRLIAFVLCGDGRVSLPRPKGASLGREGKPSLVSSIISALFLSLQYRTNLYETTLAFWALRPYAARALSCSFSILAISALIALISSSMWLFPSQKCLLNPYPTRLRYKNNIYKERVSYESDRGNFHI